MVVKCIELKLKMSKKILAAIMKCLISVNYWTKSKSYDNSNKFVIGKMKDETSDVANEEFATLKPKRYFFFW